MWQSVQRPGWWDPTASQDSDDLQQHPTASQGSDDPLQQATAYRDRFRHVMHNIPDSSELHYRLGRVSKFNVKVNFSDQATAAGEGRVVVEHISPTSLLWRETGHWKKCFDDLDFTNIYRWTRLEHDRIALEHLRFGENNPVWLVDIEQNGRDDRDASWVSRSPHLCGQDSYALKLVFSTRGLKLAWTIKGPEKNQVSTICYT